MFLTMAVGFGVVRAGLFKTEDSRIISNMVVYICNPCVVVHAFQIELTDDKIKGLMIAVGMSVIVHVILIVGSEIIIIYIHFNSIEKASIIYTNAGYLVIPLVSAVLGEEWVFYTTAFILVQTILMWTHGVNLIGQEKNLNIRKILCNPECNRNDNRNCTFCAGDPSSGSDRQLCQRVWRYDQSGEHDGDRNGDR